jgi:hypothetical protein
MTLLKKRLKSALVILTIIFSVSHVAMAQDDFPSDVDDEGIPIDGGISLLLAAGAAYGVKKVYNARKEEES